MKDHSEKTDEELLNEYLRDQNPQLINILFLRYSDVGFRTAMRYMRNQSDAEDVLQLAFIEFLQSLHLFREGATTVKPWLMKMIVNTSIDKLREEKRRTKRQKNVASQRLQEQTQSSPEQLSSDKEELKIKIKGIVDTLPEKYRSPIWLVLYEGFSYPEVAAVLALPEKTIRTQVARGLERLRQAIGSLGVNLSVVLIADLISKSKLEVAPNSFKEIINSPQFYQSIKKKSQRVAMSFKKSSSNFYLKFIIPISAVLVIITGFYFWPKNNQPTIMQKKEVEIQPLHIAMQFDTPKEVQPYQFLGNFTHLNKEGLKKSGCIEFKSSFVLKFPIEKQQLPIKISFRLNCKEDNPNDHTDFPLIIWESWNNLTRLSGLDDVKTPQGDWGVYLKKDEDWHDETVWITEKSVDIWVNGKRVFLDTLDPSEDNKNLYLVFWKNLKIDNFKLESVANDKLPDFSRYLAIVAKISDNKPKEEVDLTEYLLETKNNKLKPCLKKFPASSKADVLDFLKNLKAYKKNASAE